MVFVHHSTAYAILRAAFNQLLKRGREVLSFDANLDSRGHTGFTTLKCSTKDEKIYFYCLQTDTQIQSCQLFKLSNTYKTAQWKRHLSHGTQGWSAFQFVITVKTLSSWFLRAFNVDNRKTGKKKA